MDKPTYRYNHKTGQWIQVFRFSPVVMISTGVRNPVTGLPNFVKALPFEVRGSLGHPVGYKSGLEARYHG